MTGGDGLELGEGFEGGFVQGWVGGCEHRAVPAKAQFLAGPIGDNAPRGFHDRGKGGPVPGFQAAFRHDIHLAEGEQAIGLGIAAPIDTAAGGLQPGEADSTGIP